jgi:hypothetical protein
MSGFMGALEMNGLRVNFTSKNGRLFTFSHF